jgi:hypothetical protein
MEGFKSYLYNNAKSYGLRGGNSKLIKRRSTRIYATTLE